MRDVEPIGKVELKYGAGGELLTAAFHPLIQIRHACGLVKGLGKIKCDAPENIKHQADLVLAEWFEKVSQIELADRDEYEVVGEVEECTKDNAGHVVKSIIAYSLQHKQGVSRPN